MQRRKFVSVSLSALAGLIIPRAVFKRELISEHLVYRISIRKGLLGRGVITGHLQINYDAPRYSIALWAEDVTRKLLFIPIGRKTEEEVMDLVLDPEHVNPLRIRCIAYGKIVGNELRSEGMVVSDKKNGREVSHLLINTMTDGGAATTYSSMGKTCRPGRFQHRVADPLTAMISVSLGQRSVPTVSLSSAGGSFVLGGRVLSVYRDGSSHVVKTGPDADGRFWDFKSDTYLELVGERISRLRIARYNVFKSIDVKRERNAPLEDLGLEQVFVGT